MELLKIHHPDKNRGDASKFIQIHYAFNVLRNNNTRTLYDLYSYEGLDGDPPFDPYVNMNKLVERSKTMNNNNSNSPKDVIQKYESVEVPKHKDVRVDLVLGLKQLYNGKNIGVRIKKKIWCESCVLLESGKCDTCCGDGGGEADGFCKVCGGLGKVSLLPNIHCPKCRGNHGKMESKMLNVIVE
eukprot:UN31000